MRANPLLETHRASCVFTISRYVEFFCLLKEQILQTHTCMLDVHLERFCLDGWLKVSSDTADLSVSQHNFVYHNFLCLHSIPTM